MIDYARATVMTLVSLATFHRQPIYHPTSIIMTIHTPTFFDRTHYYTSCHIIFLIILTLCSLLRMSLATFLANVPVIFVTLRSSRFENDSVAKLMASLAASDIVNGIIAACCAGVAWSLQPGDQVPTWLLRIIFSGMYTFDMCSILRRR